MARNPSVSESLAEVVPDPRNHKDRDLRGQRFPQAAVKDSEWSYIRREGDDRDKLFHLREDPNEDNDRAEDPSARTMLERKRAELERLTGGALVPGASVSDAVGLGPSRSREVDLRPGSSGLPVNCRSRRRRSARAGSSEIAMVRKTRDSNGARALRPTGRAPRHRGWAGSGH